MKPKTLIILAAVTALLGAFVYFVERDLPSTDERQELETKVLALETDDVTAITLKADGREVRLERVEPEALDDVDAEGDESETSSLSEPEWRLTAPVEARADSQAVDSFLGSLMALNLERTLEDVDTTAAGLDEPRAVVMISTADGETTLEVGADVPLSQDALVRVAGETGGTAAANQVVQTGFGESMRETVGQDAGAWRDKRLFFARRNEVQQMSWTGPDGSRAVLTRSGNGDNFYLDEPVQDRADQERVRGLLSTLTSLEAASFVDDESVGASFAPQARFEVTIDGEDTPWLLELAELGAVEVGAGEHLARVGGSNGTLVRLAAGPVTEALGGPSDKWRSSAWTHQQSFQIDEVILDQAGEELLAIRRNESDWLRTTGDAARVAEDAEGEMAGDEVPYTAASNVLYPLTEVKAERLVTDTAELDSEAGVDLSEPQLSITLASEDGEETLRLYGRTEDGLFAARTEGRDVVLLLPAEKIDELLGAVQSLRDAEPVPPPALDPIDLGGEAEGEPEGEVEGEVEGDAGDEG